MDPGSEISLVSSALVSKLQLPKRRAAVQLSGVGDTAFGTTTGAVQLTLRSCHGAFTITITAHVMERLLTALPSFDTETLHWPHLTGLALADPGFLQTAPIDILVGADAFGQILMPGVIKAGPCAPVAQQTQFGWLVFGPTGPALAGQATALHLRVSTDQLQDLLCRFWTQEEVPSALGSQFSPAELECEAHYRRTHGRDSSGRYVVRLPFSAPSSSLGSSGPAARACLRRLMIRLERDPRLGQLYREFLQEYEALGHMRRLEPQVSSPARSGVPVPVEGVDEMTLAHEASASGGLRVSDAPLDGQDGSRAHYFLPHHGVLRESSSTTKLRVVFNGSAKTTSGTALNDLLHGGAKLQRDIADVLLWIRRHRFIFMADIVKMFRQIKVHEDDWPFQQILWTGSQGEPATFQLTTVTYGTRPAPFLACRTLLQLVEDEGPRYPLAVPPMLEGRYVDDICGGADSLDQLVETGLQVRALCAAGGFPLAKWQTNHHQVLSRLQLPEADDLPRPVNAAETKILGLLWDPLADCFGFNIQSTSSSIVSKRTILAELARLYDPLGFLAPVVVRGKILLQDLWIDKLGWDDEVSPLTAQRWSAFREDLLNLAAVRVPRWLHLGPHSEVEVHGFADASQAAMAAAVYFKVSVNGEVPQVVLVCAKTRVAPLKRLTIPRLELTAAVLLVRLVRYVVTRYELSNARIRLWTDSSVALAWISSHPSRWKEFVRNRVQLIQELPATWGLIPGKENPADCASRGTTVGQLVDHALWWHGPPWLTSEENGWPALDHPSEDDVRLEEKPGVVLTTREVRPACWEIVERFSSLNKLLRVTATCQRAIARFRRTPSSSLASPLTLGDVERARVFWVRTTQVAHFRAELAVLVHGSSLRSAHPLARLTPFVDRAGVLRVGGRLALAPLTHENKHPAILPRSSAFSELVIRESHLRTFHGGNQLTLADLRQKYWILGGRAPIRSFILRCVVCARHRGVRAQQLMGQLPISRLSPVRAFLHTGVDYAGPVSLRAWKGRGHKTHKGWLAVFVCMTTSAVHLEVVSDYSADAFIAAYRRFVARRGLCRNMYSDCGTTFVGADRALKKLFSSVSSGSHQLAHLLLQDGTRWSFNPPGAPHFGGKWEAAVKSVKYHLARTIGEDRLTFEEFSTLLAQVEAVLNSRPLEPLSDDPDDFAALTPGHFLVGGPLTAIPEPSIEERTIPPVARWRLLQQKVQRFWKTWSSSYLQRLQAISKWHHALHEVKVGSVVLLSGDNIPPTKWPLARVTKLHPGKDGLTRVVTLRTASSTFDRPIAKLILLPGTSDVQLDLPSDPRTVNSDASHSG